MKIVVHNYLPRQRTLDAPRERFGPLPPFGSPDVRKEFERRWALRKSWGEEGIAKAERLLIRWKALRAKVKKLHSKAEGGYQSGLPQGFEISSVVHRINSAKADYGLAIQNMSDVRKFDEWLAKGDEDIKVAEENLSALEKRV